MVREIQEKAVREDTVRLEYTSPTERVQRLGPERFALYQRNRTAASASFLRLCEMRAGLVDGPVSELQVPVSDVRAMARQIKDFARYLGADLVGISRLKDSYVYLARDLPHTYVISMAVEMDYGMIKTAPGRLSITELWRAYNTLSEMVVHLAAHIRGLGYSARGHHVRTGDLLLIPCAVDAGLGEPSKMGLLITKKYGPRVRLGAVTTDLPLAVDQPVALGVQDFCQKCSKCARHCPMQAVPEKKSYVRGVYKWAIDGERCLETFSKAFGCGICIRYCPWNKPDTLLHQISREAAARSSLARTILTRADDWIYGS